MDEPSRTSGLRKDAGKIEKTTVALERKAAELADAADRRTVLATDRTYLAAERTYAAWMRTALAALASGVGARALMRDVLPDWTGKVSGSVLVAFALFCLIASAVYIFNDLSDVEADREHPEKRNRPIASGKLPVGVAWAAG